MGGVLADTEGEAQQRTPGLASLPIVGNLFKRKLTTRQNSEILFFITPHIYRPDYNGRPTAGTVSNGTQRSTTIPQPVPLGNPPSNTPTPTQLQQQPSTTPSTQPQLLGAPLPNSPSGATTARPGSLSGQRP
jgi:type II secretory pathway component GspD/PulD (secretin)